MNKKLAIVIISDNFIPALDTLLQQLQGQVWDHEAQVSVTVMADQPSEQLVQAMRAYLFATLVQSPEPMSRQQALMAAYARTDADYVWVLLNDTQVSDDALAKILPLLDDSKQSVLLLNRLTDPFPIPIPEIWDFDRIGRAAELRGFIDTFISPDCFVCPAGIPLDAWPTYPAAEAHVYMYLRNFFRTPVKAIGARLVTRQGTGQQLEEWVRAAQWVRLLCTALVENRIDGVDDTDALLRIREHSAMFLTVGTPQFHAIVHWLDGLWKFRRPIHGEATLAYWRLLHGVAPDLQYLTPLNRAAELCPGSNGLFHGQLQKQPFWITDIIQKSQQQGSEVTFALQRHGAAPQHPFGYSLALPGQPLGELTQQEVGELYHYIKGNELQRGVEIGTQMGLSSVTAAMAMHRMNETSQLFCIPTEESDGLADISQDFIGKSVGMPGGMIRTVVAKNLDALTALLESKLGEDKLTYAFIDGLNRPLEYVREALAALQPHLAPIAHVFLRNNPFHPLVNHAMQELYGTQFTWLPHCGRPWGMGIAVARINKS